MKIVLATHNKDKCKEMMDALSTLDVELLTLDQFPQINDIVEDGETLEENALIKAREVFKKTSYAAISDDTGLEVDILNGEPGVYSARYSGENATYSDNVNKLIEEMKDVDDDNRSAQFRTCMAFVDGNTELIANGVVKGQITPSPKGNGGFGYDPIFYIEKLNKTFAEMTLEEKNKISHRGIALRNLKEILHAHFNHPQIQEKA
jgi:XTP/dITP diphosphohydrolase